jgi:hypothetical protein
MKKTKLLTAILTTFALTACGGISFSSESGNSEVNFDELSNQPNRTLLRSLASMMSNPGNAIRTNLDVSAEVYSQIVLPNYQTENTFQIAATADLAVNTPETGNGNAELNIDFDRFAVMSSSSAVDQDFSWTDEIVVENQTAKLYIEEGFAYVDLSEDATTIARLLFPSENREFPTQFKTPFDLQTATGNLIPQLTEENIDLWVEASLPMVDALNLLDKSLSGSTLSIRYEITQEDLPILFENMYLGSTTRDQLNEEENLLLDEWLEESLAAITLNQFQISFSINLLTNLLEGLWIDIDVENQYRFELRLPVYDPENPEADEYGYIEGDPYSLEWTYNYDFEITAQMEVLTESMILVAPINKEEYELIDLDAEDPNLF